MQETKIKAINNFTTLKGYYISVLSQNPIKKEFGYYRITRQYIELKNHSSLKIKGTTIFFYNI